MVLFTTRTTTHTFLYQSFLRRHATHEVSQGPCGDTPGGTPGPTPGGIPKGPPNGMVYAMGVSLQAVPRGKPVGLEDVVRIPVGCLLWTHGRINKQLQFRNGKSILSFFDQLFRRDKEPDDVQEPLDIVISQEEGLIKLYSTSNRRLLVLLMLQAARRNETVWVRCVIRPQDGKFREALQTQNGGLGVEPFSGLSKHLDNPLWDPCKAALQQIKRLASSHPREPELSGLAQRIRRRPSRRTRSVCSLTLAPTRQRPRSPVRAAKAAALRQPAASAQTAQGMQASCAEPKQMPRKRRAASALRVLAMFKKKQKNSEDNDSNVLQELLPAAILKTNKAEDQVEKAVITSELIEGYGDDFNEEQQAVEQTEMAAAEALSAIGEARLFLNAKVKVYTSQSTKRDASPSSTPQRYDKHHHHDQ